MTQNITKLMNDRNINNEENHQTLSNMNSKRFTGRHIIIKFIKAKDKENKNLKSIKTEA